ncbi:MAG: oligosaccharide flippase family protein, partial [Thermoleophilia bacterium]|nr:oligosaccharide flippase family protein [Thermoleophilia bacterium]
MSATHPAPSRSRGLLLLTVSNAVYILGGYVLTVALAHILGKSGFGSYGVVASFATVINMLVTRGVPIAAARGIAAHAEAAGDWVAASRYVMLPLSIGLAVVGIVAAWPLASLLGDSSLRLPMQVGALLALTFGFQAQLFSWMYGTENYNRQAVGQMAYGLGRVVTIVGGAQVAGLTGAIVGFVLGPLIGALPLVTRRPAGSSIAERNRLVRTLISSAMPIVVTATGVTLLMVVDIIAFKSVATKPDVGLYTAAASLAHIPYFLLQAASFVLLPSVAAAAAGPGLRAAVVKGVT